MSKKCTECGHRMSDYATVCPNCGCPVEEVVETKSAEKEPAAPVADAPEAEAFLARYARAILIGGRVLAVVLAIAAVVCCIIGCIVESFSIGGWIVCIIAGLAGAVILFYTALFLSKLIWARIMLRVNISNNLKRILLK